MFKDCAKLERNMFVTWKENDVNEQDVDERKRMLRKKKNVKKEKECWVISESNLSQI